MSVASLRDRIGASQDRASEMFSGFESNVNARSIVDLPNDLRSRLNKIRGDMQNFSLADNLSSPSFGGVASQPNNSPLLG